MDLEERQYKEAEFFRLTPPWSTETQLKDKFGVPNLSQELSRQLVALTRACLPEMSKSLNQTLGEVSAELSLLPPRLG